MTRRSRPAPGTLPNCLRSRIRSSPTFPAKAKSLSATPDQPAAVQRKEAVSVFRERLAVGEVIQRDIGCPGRGPPDGPLGS
jgi:hypothetical protein